MHHEVLKPKGISGTTHYCIFASIALLALFVAPFAQKTIFPVMNYVVYFAIVVTAAALVKRQMTEYRYSLIDNELIFDRLFGKHVRKLVTINLSDAKAFGPYRTTKSAKVKTLYYTMKPAKKAYALIAKVNGVDQRIVFHPSEKMINCIERQMKRNKDDKAA